MARRSGRVGKIARSDGATSAREPRNFTQQVKGDRQSRNSLSARNAFQPNSSLLKMDVQGLFASVVERWSLLTEEQKSKLINAFPPSYRVHSLNDNGALQCPISVEFARDDAIVRRDVARFKRDIESGCYMKKWQKDSKKAMIDRAQGQFDEYTAQCTEDCFGPFMEPQEA